MTEKHKANLYLACKLTVAELQEQSKALANAIRVKTQKLDAIETFKAQAKAEIAELEAIINKSSSLINSEIEFRDIDCTVDYDWKKGIKIYFRNDSGEQVKQENVTTDERQNQFALEGEIKK